MTNESNEADWAYRYGQEARLRHEIEERYTALVYDMGVLLGNIGTILPKLARDEADWVEELPKLVDNMFDSGCHIQYFLGNPVGSFKDNEHCQKAIEGVKRQGSWENVESTGTGEELDEAVEQYLRAHWKAMMKHFDEWIKAEPPLHASYKKRRNSNRAEKTEELLPLFLKLLKLHGHSEDAQRLMDLLEEHTTH